MIETLTEHQFLFHSPPPKFEVSCIINRHDQTKIDQPKSYDNCKQGLLLYATSSGVDRFNTTHCYNPCWISWKGIVVGLFEYQMDYQCDSKELSVLEKDITQVIDITYIFVQNKWRRKNIGKRLIYEWINVLKDITKPPFVIRIHVDKVFLVSLERFVISFLADIPFVELKKENGDRVLLIRLPC